MQTNLMGHGPAPGCKKRNVPTYPLDTFDSARPGKGGQEVEGEAGQHQNEPVIIYTRAETWSLYARVNKYTEHGDEGVHKKHGTLIRRVERNV